MMHKWNILSKKSPNRYPFPIKKVRLIKNLSLSFLSQLILLGIILSYYKITPTNQKMPQEEGTPLKEQQENSLEIWSGPDAPIEEEE